MPGPRGLLTMRVPGDRAGPSRARLHPRGWRGQLGVAWKTVWGSIQPILNTLAADEGRFAGVTTLGVDDHLGHHVDTRKRGPKELTGMVDLTRGQGIERSRPGSSTWCRTVRRCTRRGSTPGARRSRLGWKSRR